MAGSSGRAVELGRHPRQTGYGTNGTAGDIVDLPEVYGITPQLHGSNLANRIAVALRCRVGVRGVFQTFKWLGTNRVFFVQ